MNPIEAGKEALEAIVLPLREEKQRLTERIAEIDQTLVPLVKAIDPLGKRPRSSKKPKPGVASRTVTQEDVRQAFLELLAKKPSASKETLLAAAKKTLKVEQGLDLKGFPNRCREVLGDKAFEIDEAGRVRLAAAPTASRAPREAFRDPDDPNSVVENFATGVLGR